MATRRFSINVGDTQEQIVDAVGAATVTKSIELTIDQATTVVTDRGTTRAIKKGEVDTALILLREYIYKSLNLAA